jgi:hypothetical protein
MVRASDYSSGFARVTGWFTHYKGVMRTAALERWARLTTGALALLTVTAVAPRSVSAGCDHPFGSNSDPFNIASRMDGLIVGGPSGILQGELPASPSGEQQRGRRSPCKGLSCSGRTPLPASSASEGADGWDHWGALGTLANLTSAPRTRRSIEECIPSSVGGNTSIFHPPRV